MVWADQIIPRQDANRSLLAVAEDGHRIEVHLTGEGTQAAPYVVFARALPPPGVTSLHTCGPDDGGHPIAGTHVKESEAEQLPRFPTVDELIGACDVLLEAGALMSLGFVTVSPEDRPAADLGAQGGIQLSQIGQATLPGRIVKPNGAGAVLGLVS